MSCLSTFYNVTIGIKQQCLFSLFMYFNNFATIIIREDKHKNLSLCSSIIIVQQVNYNNEIVNYKCTTKLNTSMHACDK